jgi:hypothetical protein
MIQNNNMNNNIPQNNYEPSSQNSPEIYDINMNNNNNNNNVLYQNPQNILQAQANIINNLQNQEDQNTNNNIEENFDNNNNNNNNDYLEEPEQQKIDTIPTQNKSHPSMLNNNNNNYNNNINYNNMNNMNNNNNNLSNNISQNNTITNNKSNKNLNYSRISKSNSQIPNNQNFFQNFDIQALTYSLNKDYNQLHISKDEKFLERMKFDVYKRQIREDRINKLIEQNKPTIDEEERIKAFNRLIEDANRRIEAQENLENMKNKLEEDITQAPSKKYKEDEWNEIYKKRFKKYEEESNKKMEEVRKQKIEQEKKKEEDVINMCKVKKAPMKHIEEASKRMYKESIKRKLKMQEKISRFKNNNNNNLYEDDPNKYKKIVKSEAYNFMSDNDDGVSYNINNMFNQNPYRNAKKITKKKGQAVTEFNNKRFDTRKKVNYSNNNNYYNNIFKNTFNPMENNNFVNNNNVNFNNFNNNQIINNENFYNNNNLNDYLEDENEIKDIPQPVMREYNEDVPMDIRELEGKNIEISAIKRLNNNNNNQKDYYNHFQQRALNSQKIQNNINNFGENEASKIVDQFFIQKK